MKPRTWVITGATSIIAEQFAHLAASKGHSLRLVGRDEEQLQIRASDIALRYRVPCEVLVLDMKTAESKEILSVLRPSHAELDLFLAHSDFTSNAELNTETLSQLVAVNILASTVLIQQYLSYSQKQHKLLYLSSVAASRGRAKNSLYAASKAAIELYLEGLQQTAPANQQILTARLGFIDTQQTYGLPGVFYAAPPEACARACWNALEREKRLFYFPSFWKPIAWIIRHLPFFIYKKMSTI